MMLDVSECLNNKESVLLIGTDVELDTERLQNSSVISIVKSFLNGKVVNFDGTLKLTGVLSVNYIAQCARCLENFEKLTELDVEVDFSKDADYDDLDCYNFSGKQIPLGLVMTDLFIMNMPIREVCDEDCLGLCPTCGINLNQSKCDCRLEYINPKFEALRSFENNVSDNNEEV